MNQEQQNNGGKNDSEIQVMQKKVKELKKLYLQWVDTISLTLFFIAIFFICGNIMSHHNPDGLPGIGDEYLGNIELLNKTTNNAIPELNQRGHDCLSVSPFLGKQNGTLEGEWVWVDELATTTRLLAGDTQPTKVNVTGKIAVANLGFSLDHKPEFVCFHHDFF